LGGAYQFKGTYGNQITSSYAPIEATKQKEAIRFVVNEMVNCNWLNNVEITQLLGSETDEITKWQSGVIGNVLGNFILTRIVSNEPLYYQNRYSLTTYLKDVDNQIWISTAKPQLTDFDRHIQIAYIDRLCALVQPLFTISTKSEPRQANETVWASVAASQLTATRAKVSQLSAAQPQNAGHYKLIISMIDNIAK
jgi:hypothetical protein